MSCHRSTSWSPVSKLTCHVPCWSNSPGGVWTKLGNRLPARRHPNVSQLLGELVASEVRRRGVPVVNASGVLLHTNLGRAPWPEAAVESAARAARHYSNVELDLATGTRDRRGQYVSRLISLMTGAEDALVVNNNAAALFLSLATLASGKAVPVARGELIEIGGSYRLPDVMAASQAKLVEVGTTNRVRVGDYQVAMQTHDCGAILKIHPSNYQVVGFTAAPSISELRAGTDEIPLLFDVGSGLLDADAPWVPAWLGGEPAVKQSLSDGADLVMFSGDKLLGGPSGRDPGRVRRSDHAFARLRVESSFPRRRSHLRRAGGDPGCICAGQSSADPILGIRPSPTMTPSPKGFRPLRRPRAAPSRRAPRRWAVGVHQGSRFPAR